MALGVCRKGPRWWKPSISTEEHWAPLLGSPLGQAALVLWAHKQQSNGGVFYSVVVQETGWSVPHWDKWWFPLGPGQGLCDCFNPAELPAALSPAWKPKPLLRFRAALGLHLSLFYFFSARPHLFLFLFSFFKPVLLGLFSFVWFWVFLYPRLVCLGPVVDSISKDSWELSKCAVLGTCWSAFWERGHITWLHCFLYLCRKLWFLSPAVI